MTVIDCDVTECGKILKAESNSPYHKPYYTIFVCLSLLLLKL